MKTFIKGLKECIEPLKRFEAVGNPGSDGRSDIKDLFQKTRKTCYHLINLKHNYIQDLREYL